MKILITGANGMLATNMIEVLLEKGYSVRGLLRRRESYKGIVSDSLQLVEGDFTCYETAAAAMKGCGGVIHAAAIIAQNLLRLEEYEKVNVNATQHLLTLAKVYQIKKFVYVSSANTIGCGTAANPGKEDTPCRKPLADSLYGRSKAAAERLVIQAGGVIVNPTFMIGKYGSPAGSNKILKMARRITLCPPGGKNFIRVEDAARSIVAAMEHGQNGEKYIIAGENISFKDFFRQFTQVQKIIVIPRWILLTAGFFGSLARTAGIKTSLSLTNTRILCLPMAYDNSKLKTFYRQQQPVHFQPPLRISPICGTCSETSHFYRRLLRYRSKGLLSYIHRDTTPQPTDRTE